MDDTQTSKDIISNLEGKVDTLIEKILQPLTKECDCSGFVAWTIGIPRELPPGSGKWLQTTTYWQGGSNVGSGLFDHINENLVEPGDLLVYPDNGNKQGHMGIVSRVKDNRVSKVIHCSSGNFKRHGDAILETDPGVFTRNSKTRLMRIDYSALRDLFDIAETDSDTDDIPYKDAELKHDLFSHDSTLRKVAMGLLVLEPTGERVGGAGAVQDALNLLAKRNSKYSISLGPNKKYRGYYGPKTSKAIKNFQSEVKLPKTGEINSPTLLALDSELLSLQSTITSFESIAETDPVIISLSTEKKDYYASVNNGERFYIGKKVPYLQNYGLTNYFKSYGERYKPEKYVSKYGHWAYFIYPIAICESNGYFNRINTYDRAYFTFGFLQFAAHTPNENFVKLFRNLLSSSSSSRYFPDLVLIDGFINRIQDNTALQLEDSKSTDLLMNYLNPSIREVEEVEAINAAKLVHWSNTYQNHRNIQVTTAIDKIQNGLKKYAIRYPLDGLLDKVCLVVADIRHQGRGRSTEILDALNTDGNEEKMYKNLLDIGSHHYESRIKKLEKEIEVLVDAGILGKKRYHKANNDFQ